MVPPPAWTANSMASTASRESPWRWAMSAMAFSASGVTVAFIVAESFVVGTGSRLRKPRGSGSTPSSPRIRRLPQRLRWPPRTVVAPPRVVPAITVYGPGMSQVSVITGGAGGMGLATAKIVGRDHALVLCDVRQDRLDAAAAALKDLGIDPDGRQLRRHRPAGGRPDCSRPHPASARSPR